MGYRAIFGAAVVLFLSLTGTGSAQDLPPLVELMQEDTEDTYPLVRCGGFYLSMLEWAGEDVPGPEQSRIVKLTVYNLINAAASWRSEISETTVQHQVDLALRDVRNIADLYLQRYQDNYAAVGQAWGADTLWRDDQAVCNILTSGEGQ